MSPDPDGRRANKKHGGDSDYSDNFQSRNQNIHHPHGPRLGSPAIATLTANTIATTMQTAANCSEGVTPSFPRRKSGRPQDQLPNSTGNIGAANAMAAPAKSKIAPTS